MSTKYRWLEVAQNLQSIAQAGLTYTDNKYDIERFEQIMQISKEIIRDHSTMPMQKLDDLFDMETGYLTPKIDIRAVIMEDEKMLLIKEEIDGKWALPGGWADVGHTPSEVAVKEVWEESGLEVTVDRLLAVFDKRCHPHPPEIYYVYKFFFLCSKTGGHLKPGMETSDARFFGLNELPILSKNRNTRSQLEKMFELAKHRQETLFD